MLKCICIQTDAERENEKMTDNERELVELLREAERQGRLEEILTVAFATIQAITEEEGAAEHQEGKIA